MTFDFDSNAVKSFSEGPSRDLFQIDKAVYGKKLCLLAYYYKEEFVINNRMDKKRLEDSMDKIEKILIIDGHEANLLFLELLVSEMGFAHVFKAKTADEGLDIVEKQVIQFILVALELNYGMSGTLLFKKPKQNEKENTFLSLSTQKRCPKKIFA